MAYLVLLLLLSLLSPPSLSSQSPNPFTEKAALIRYWKRKIPNNLPHPSFFLSKVTPLSSPAAAAFLSLASSDPSLLSSRLPSFCSSAGLLCPSDPSLSSHPAHDSGFAAYQDSNFTNYATTSTGGLSSFKNYSDSLNVPVDTFRRYGRDSTFHNDRFSFYSPDGNVITANFTSYGVGSRTVGGSHGFSSYGKSSNVPDLGFTNYASDSTGPDSRFSEYSAGANAGGQSFDSYAKSTNAASSDFASYANDTNVVSTNFAHYARDANGPNSTFASYGGNGNVPENSFRSYGDGVNGGTDRFSAYRDGSNVGDDSFASYEKGGNLAVADFSNYGHSANPGSETFKGYGEGSFNDRIAFKEYFADNTSFKAYSKTVDVGFKGYHNSSTSEGRTERRVEPGRFFRESSLREGTVMPMPDIRDRMPKRSFLPRSIAGKIPFSATAVGGLFRILPGTAMGRAVDSTIADCGRAPSRGETKRCAASPEDMIDFAVAVLGDDIEVRSTASSRGAKGDVLIGDVRGVNGGKVTMSVSCHQSLFPYLVHYCHSVPRVRVYTADILAVDSKEKINQGVAICHLDTSDWSAAHGAFVALGPGPGKIEVCHWIFEGDMTWTVADRP